MIGESVGSYQIVGKLSVGGMGTVYKAEHTLIGRLAAVKVLHPELSGSRDIVNRFFNEAKATTAIKHPGIVEVFDFGYMASGHAYLVMEFLEGMSLARRIKTRGRMAEGEAAMMLRAVCSALAAAHAKGIIHRDLKPDNIFLVPDQDSATGERPKLLDFGIAKLTAVGLAGSATKTGAVMGTPTYMSPEQCRGTGDVDHRADFYSIGCIFYELVCGRPPFTSLGAGELLGAHLYVEPAPPSRHNKELSKDTERLIMALLSKQPERRPQSARELAQRLTALAQNLGWITATSPNGITSELLHPLPAVARPAALDDLLRTTEPPDAPSQPPAVTRPYGTDTPVELSLLSASVLEPQAEPTTRPTTLSGAASQPLLDVRRRARRGIGIALATVALAAAGAVVAVQLTGDDARATAALPIAGPASRAMTPAIAGPHAAPAATAPAATRPAAVTAPAATSAMTAPASAAPGGGPAAAPGSAAGDDAQPAALIAKSPPPRGPRPAARPAARRSAPAAQTRDAKDAKDAKDGKDGKDKPAEPPPNPLFEPNLD